MESMRRRMMQTDHSWESAVEEYLSVYKSILGE
jgi:hypothetical protein